jgi:hypothetical protein
VPEPPESLYERARREGPRTPPVEVQRAVYPTGNPGNVQVCRRGDRSGHFHSAASRDEIAAPPLPHDLWQANVDAVAAALAA